MPLFDSVPLTADNQTGTDDQRSRNQKIDPLAALSLSSEQEGEDKVEAEAGNETDSTQQNRQLLTDDPEFKSKRDALLTKTSARARPSKSETSSVQHLTNLNSSRQ